MPKKMRLNLEEFKIKSFVTSLTGTEGANVKGGITIPYTNYSACCGQAFPYPTEVCEPSVRINCN
jgi:hypothetical protein